MSDAQKRYAILLAMLSKPMWLDDIYLGITENYKKLASNHLIKQQISNDLTRLKRAKLVRQVSAEQRDRPAFLKSKQWVANAT